MVWSRGGGMGHTPFSCKAGTRDIFKIYKTIGWGGVSSSKSSEKFRKMIDQHQQALCVLKLKKGP